MKEKALDHTPSRTRFGRNYGPVVRESTELINVTSPFYIQTFFTLFGFKRPYFTFCSLIKKTNFSSIKTRLYIYIYIFIYLFIYLFIYIHIELHYNTYILLNCITGVSRDKNRCRIAVAQVTWALPVNVNSVCQGNICTAHYGVMSLFHIRCNR